MGLVGQPCATNARDTATGQRRAVDLARDASRRPQAPSRAVRCDLAPSKEGDDRPSFAAAPAVHQALEWIRSPTRHPRHEEVLMRDRPKTLMALPAVPLAPCTASRGVIPVRLAWRPEGGSL